MSAQHLCPGNGEDHAAPDTGVIRLIRFNEIFIICFFTHHNIWWPKVIRYGIKFV